VHVRFSESQATEPPEKKQHIDPFADLRDRALSGPTTVITSVEEELASYKSLRLSSAVSPLPFWQEHSRTYPILSTVARRACVRHVGQLSTVEARFFRCWTNSD